MKKKEYLIFSSILFVVIILYLPGINSYFVNDDYNWLKPANFYDVISTFWSSWGHGALYRPVTRLLLYIQFLFFGDSPTGYHLFSIFLQALLTFLFYKIVFNLSKNFVVSIISVIACIFYVGNHEVVCWISSQTVLLGVTFSFASVLFYQKYLEKGSNKFIIISFFSYIAALLSYESSVVVPLLLVSISLFGKIDLFAKKSVRLFSVYILLSILYLILRHFFLADVPEANSFNTNPSVMISNFLKLIKFQIITKPYFLIIIIISIVNLILSKPHIKHLLYGFGWFIIAFIPFLFVDGYTGRFSYFAMFGLFFVIGSGIALLMSQKILLKIVCVLILLSYSVIGSVLINKNAYYWYEAGEIAKSIPLQVKEIYPKFPENSTLIFYDIPLGYKQSGIFLTYFEDAVQYKYQERLNIIHVSHPFNRNFNDSIYIGKQNVYKFKYYLEERALKSLN